MELLNRRLGAVFRRLGANLLEFQQVGAPAPFYGAPARHQPTLWKFQNVGAPAPYKWRPSATFLEFPERWRPGAGEWRLGAGTSRRSAPRRQIPGPGRQTCYRHLFKVPLEVSVGFKFESKGCVTPSLHDFTSINRGVFSHFRKLNSSHSFSQIPSS